ncbi:adenine deaminase [Halobacteriales archaeon QS_1_68_20]|nr:MAG: adenine deaminase [Halobacteriales archaeon QS_1_68_20]
MNDLQPVAFGDEPADLAITNGTVVLPGLRKTRERDVVVRGDRVAALPESAGPVVGPDTTVVDAAGAHVVPGFVDAHTHVDVGATVERTYHYSLLGGTTAIVTEASSFGAALGARAVEELLAVDETLPVAVRPTVPPQPLYDTFEPARADDDEAGKLAELLAHDRVVGVGEVGWAHVVGTDTPAERLFERARAEDKRVTGHGAGASGEKLAAFATVVDDDHEAIRPEGVVERVAQGLHAIGRSGSVRDDMAAFVDAVEQLGPAECSLCTDGVWPRDLIEGEHMDAVVRRAIEEGVDPVDAVRMATLNPARHFGLADRGSLSPGSVADLVVLSDLESVAVRDIVAGGDLVVSDGDPLVGPREHDYPDAFYDSVAADPTPEDFQIPANATSDGRVRAIANGEGLLTDETTVEPPVEDGTLAASPDEDLLLAGLLDRHPDGPGAGDSPAERSGFTGFLTGYGLDSGAVATTVTWEVSGLLAVGVSPGAMATAARRVVELGGGWAIVDDGEVVVDVPLSLAGVAADAPLPEVADAYAGLERALREQGSDADRPLLALQTLSFPGVPRLKLSFSGYADVVRRRTVGLAPGREAGAPGDRGQ